MQSGAIGCRRRLARARSVAAAVVARLEDSDAGVRWVALQTLGKLKAVVLAQHSPAIVALLENSDSHMRVAAVQALGKLG